jgi:hypothetical protein
MSFQNIYNENNVLDWVFDGDKNIIKTIVKSDSITTENEIIFLLTTGITSDIVVDENGITGSFYVGQDQFGNVVGSNVVNIASQMTIPATVTELRDLELACITALESLRSRAGVTDIECVSYIEDTTVFVDIIIGVNRTQIEEYQIKLWTKD